AGPWLSTAFSPDGRLLAGAGLKSLVLFDIATGAPARRLEAPGLGDKFYAHRVAFSPDGKQLLASRNHVAGGSLVCLWDVETGRLVAPLGCHTGQTVGLAFCMKGEMAVSVGHEGALRLYLVRPSPRHYAAFDLRARAFGLAMHPVAPIALVG